MTNINGRYHYSRVKFSMRYRHSNNYTQKWLQKIIMIIRFHNRTEIYLVQKWLKKIIMIIRFHNRTEIYLIQKWLKKIIMIIRFHNRTEIYLIQKGKYKK